jgi:hypothetical protein
MLLLRSSTLLAQTSTDEIRLKVQEKVQAARNKPMAFIGTITDISEAGIQIKNDLDQIQQISVSESTVYAKINKTRTNISFDDIAIGDFIVAMGYESTTDVLDAKRILLTSAISLTTRTSIIGTITSINTSEITLSSTSGEYRVDIDKQTDISSGYPAEKSRVSELEEGDEVIASGELTNNVISARRIHLTSAK